MDFGVEIMSLLIITTGFEHIFSMYYYERMDGESIKKHLSKMSLLSFPLNTTVGKKWKVKIYRRLFSKELDVNTIMCTYYSTFKSLLSIVVVLFILMHIIVHMDDPPPPSCSSLCNQRKIEGQCRKTSYRWQG